MKRFVLSLTGFTLIELVIVVTILAILAAVAIPAFQNMQHHARDSATKGILGQVRSAITLYRVNEIASGRSSGSSYQGWPSSARLRDIADDPTLPKVLENGAMPDNPWAQTAEKTNLDFVVGLAGGLCPGSTPQGRLFPLENGGWIYDECNGGFWANSNVNGETPCDPCTTGCLTENCY